MHACHELLEIERLGDVVVCPEPQALELVLLLHARRQHDDRNAQILAPDPAQLESVQARQVDVEHDQVGREGRGGADGEVAVGGAADVEALERQVVGEDPRERGVVFNDQNTLLHLRRSLREV